MLLILLRFGNNIVPYFFPSMHEIFYADDDIDDIDIFAHAIKILKEKRSLLLDLHVFNDGNSLLQTIVNKGISNATVFLDINMPGKTGLQVLGEIRQMQSFRQTPVVMYSTSADADSISKSRSMGASLYAIKPNSFVEMNELLLKILNINWENHIVDDTNFVINKDRG